MYKYCIFSFLLINLHYNSHGCLKKIHVLPRVTLGAYILDLSAKLSGSLFFLNRHWDDYPNGGPPQYQSAPIATEYERPPPYYYPGPG